MNKAARATVDDRSVDELWAELRAEFQRRHPDASLRLLDRSFSTAQTAHEGQWRRSGDPYIVHPLAAAWEACTLGMDETTVSAALCHDVIEDCGMAVGELAKRTSDDVARIVDGVTKVDRIRFEAGDEAHAATLRKMLLAMTDDVRVLVVKLCDRLHNMRTITALSDVKARRIAEETMSVYAPLAHRLGLHEIKWQLEDLGFVTLHPERYAELERLLDERAGDRQMKVDQLTAQLSERLAADGVAAQVTGRVKHLYSVYSKMVVQGRSLDDIFDLIGLRIICESELDCYTVIGVIHRLWTPVSGRFKDYLAVPTYNLYQSLHTTVMIDGHTVEVQVRTPEMHQRAEFGAAAHYLYKHEGAKPPQSAKSDWMTEAAEIDSSDPSTFLSALAAELAGDEVYVFTPAGRVVALPSGSCAVDFAYAVHTEVGHKASGARSEGRMLSLTAPLKTGQTVEIITRDDDSGPRREWLSHVVTHRARSKIRAWHNARRREADIDTGTDRLWRSLKAAGLYETDETLAALEATAKDLHFPDPDSLIAAIGSERQALRPVVARMRVRLGDLPFGVENELIAPSRRIKVNEAAIHVGGIHDMLVTMARCCTPVPGDDIVGFITRGRGISVHRSECPNVAALTGERVVPVEWGAPGSSTAIVEVEALDRSRLLADITSLLSSQKVNIVACRTLTGRDAVALLRFEFELPDATHIDEIMRNITNLDGVYAARRVTG